MGSVMQSGLGAVLLSIAMLAAFALAGGGIWMIAKPRDVRKGVLMLLASLVVVGNVLVWTI
jgi:hypothetical protein